MKTLTALLWLLMSACALGMVPSDNVRSLLATTPPSARESFAHLTTTTWDFGYRLNSIANTPNSGTITPGAATAYAYLYDELDRRTLTHLADSSRWLYSYNDRSEITSGKRYWDDWGPVPGQQYEFTYDTIGNRSATKEGGDENGVVIMGSWSTPNSLNQYSTVGQSGPVRIVGAATATAALTLNGTPSGLYRRGEYFHRMVATTNDLGPAVVSVTGVATLGGSGATNSGTTFAPAISQAMSYDADGNLTNNGIWAFRWDAENRLIQASNTTAIPTAHRLKFVFSYDYMGRLYCQKVYPWASTDYAVSPTTNTLLLYDDHRLIAELNGANTPPTLLRSYTWGIDIADSIPDGPQEAGGIGGLLMLTEHTPSTVYHFYSYDGNGNVTGLVKSDDTLSARYEYGPFHDLIARWGTVADLNPFLSSTKYRVRDLNLAYYGERWLNVPQGRWLNRDPIEEAGGLNLYAFVGNNPLNALDPFGASTGSLADLEAGSGGSVAAEGGGAAQAIGFLQRVRSAVDTFNQVQQFTSDIIDAANGDSTDLLQDLLSAPANALSSRLVGPGAKLGIAAPKGGGNFEMHHIFPQRADLKKEFQAAGINIHDWQVRLEKNVHKGIHLGGPRGGNRNDDWSHFLNSGPRGKRRSASEMFDFAIDLMQKYGVSASQLR